MGEHPSRAAGGGAQVDGQAGTNGLRSSAAVAMLTLAVLTAIPYAVPSLWRFRLLKPLPGVGSGPSLAESW